MGSQQSSLPAPSAPRRVTLRRADGADALSSAGGHEIIITVSESALQALSSDGSVAARRRPSRRRDAEPLPSQKAVEALKQRAFQDGYEKAKRDLSNQDVRASIRQRQLEADALKQAEELEVQQIEERIAQIKLKHRLSLPSEGESMSNAKINAKIQRCEDMQHKVNLCYQENRERPLLCADLVKEFSNRVNDTSKEFMTWMR